MLFVFYFRPLVVYQAMILLFLRGKDYEANIQSVNKTQESAKRGKYVFLSVILTSKHYEY